MSDDNKDDAKPEGEGAEQLTIRVKDQVSFWRIMVPLMFDVRAVCGLRSTLTERGETYHLSDVESERGGGICVQADLTT
jgi:hypothetical protein